MATIQIEVPDDVLDRVNAAFAGQYPDQTIEEFLLKVILATVQNHELPAAQAAWAEAAKSEIQSALSGIATASTVQAGRIK